MSIIMWIVLGALAGWVASIIMRTDEQQGVVGNIIVGIIGAFIGGALSQFLGGPGVSGFNLTSIIVAVLGSILLLFIVRIFSRGRHSSV